MKLYYSKGACSLSVRITLHEAGVNFIAESVNLKTKKTATGKNFLDINPKGAVPVIELDNGEILTENTAIHIYLADHYGLNQLLPPLSDFARYRVLEWLSYIASDVHKACSPLFNPATPAELCDTLFRPNLRKKLDYIEHYLQNQVYLGGDTPSLADHYFFVILGWLSALKLDISDFPALKRYHNQMKTRPAVQHALREENDIPA